MVNRTNILLFMAESSVIFIYFFASLKSCNISFEHVAKIWLVVNDENTNIYFCENENWVDTWQQYQYNSCEKKNPYNLKYQWRYVKHAVIYEQRSILKAKILKILDKSGRWFIMLINRIEGLKNISIKASILVMFFFYLNPF